MKRAVLFLHGRYSAADLPFYRGLCKQAYLVAVDGGYSFFRRAGLVPDLLLGDFDSLKSVPKQLPAKTEVVQVEIRKDQTDAELALLRCLKAGFRSIDIVQPGFGDLDHLLGNLMLLRLAERRFGKESLGPKVRILSRREEVRLVKDGEVSIRGAVGDRMSLLPLGQKVVYTCTGTDYPVRRVVLRPGETLGLRNRITAKLARFSVEGEALLIRLFGG